MKNPFFLNCKALVCLFAAMFVINIANAQRGLPLKPIATDDYSTTLQPHADTIDVAVNDTAFNGDTLCVSSVFGSARFTRLDCKSIVFKPDTSFTGNDTCRYIVCGSLSSLCDTAMVVVTVNPDYSKWPVVSSFIFSQFGACPAPDPGIDPYQTYPFVKTSVNSDTIHWVFTTVTGECTPHDTTITGDSILLNCVALAQSWGCNFSILNICEIGVNRYGTNKVCDLACNFVWNTGINELPANAISVFPNPAKAVLFLKTQGIQPQQYAIYNIQGQQINRAEFTAQITINQLSAGVYFLEIKSAEGLIRKRFVKM